MSTSTILPVIHPVAGNLHADSLARLHTAVVDAAEGIARLRRGADETTARILGKFAELHARHDRALAAEMAEQGHPPGLGGGFHHLVHAGTERLRDFFEPAGRDTLQHVLDNERHVIEAYNEALENGGPPDMMELLQRQREELGGLIAQHDSRLGGGAA